jgi:hypothetical protein
MDLIDSLHVSLGTGSSIVQHRDSLYSRRAFASTEGGFSSQNGDRACGVSYRRAAFCCAFFLCGQKGSMQRIFLMKCLRWKCLSRKAVHNRVEKFSQGRSKVADDARPGRPVEAATEATVQRVEECSHGLACSIMHD